MKFKLSAGLALVVALGWPAFAHRLDEYLQATIVSVEDNQVQLSMRLIPGVAVSSVVLAAIDTNRDGIISTTEGWAYGARVLHELSVTMDGHRLAPRLVSATFSTVEEMKEGTGEIRIELSADLPHGDTHRKLVFENHHDASISVYLVNCLAPRDTRVHILAQNRNRNQSFYELDYMQSGPGAEDQSLAWVPAWLKAVDTLAGAGNMFRMGMRHIAEGTDHLLFLLMLLVPAPLLAFGSRWTKSAGVRHSLRHILKVVTAFTLGHSFTLALAAFGFVTIPGRPVEVLIAVSIFVSAVHALRPLFPGREPAIAAFFGLVHGLAFAATLGQLGLARWARPCQRIRVQFGDRIHATGGGRGRSAVSSFAQRHAVLFQFPNRRRIICGRSFRRLDCGAALERSPARSTSSSTPSPTGVSGLQEPCSWPARSAGGWKGERSRRTFHIHLPNPRWRTWDSVSSTAQLAPTTNRRP